MSPSLDSNFTPPSLPKNFVGWLATRRDGELMPARVCTSVLCAPSAGKRLRRRRAGWRKAARPRKRTQMATEREEVSINTGSSDDERQGTTTHTHTDMPIGRGETRRVDRPAPFSSISLTAA